MVEPEPIASALVEVDPAGAIHAEVYARVFAALYPELWHQPAVVADSSLLLNRYQIAERAQEAADFAAASYRPYQGTP